MKDKATITPYLSGLTYATIFGFSFLVTKNALDHIATFHFLGLRFALAAIVMSILILLKIVKVDYRGKNIKAVLLLGILQPFTYFICETYGVKMVSSSQVGMMIALIPIFVTIFSIFFLREYVTVIQAGCIILSVSGVMFIVSMQSGFSTTGNIIGYLFVLGAVMAGAGFSVTSRKLSKQFKPFELTYVMMCIGAIAFNILGFIQYVRLGNDYGYFSPLFNLNVLPSVLYLAILSSIIAFALMNFTLSQIPAARASLFANLVTIISIIAGIFFRGEDFYWYHIAGGLMILLGVWGVNRFTRERQSRIKSEAA